MNYKRDLTDMKRQLLTAFVMMALAGASNAFGHGFRIDIDANNKIVLHTDDPNAGSRSIYEVQTLLGPSAFRSTDHPGYDVDTLNGDSGVTIGASFGFNVLGPLWYSNGGAPVPSPVGKNMVITPQDFTIPGSVTVTGTSGFQNGFLIGAYDGSTLGVYEHQFNYEIDVPGGVPVGAYALSMELTGTNNVGVPYVASDPFVIVFNNGYLISAFPALADQLYTAALPVPEPSTMVLAAIAGVGLIGFARRRRLQKA